MPRRFLTRWLLVAITFATATWLIMKSQATYDKLLHDHTSKQTAQGSTSDVWRPPVWDQRKSLLNQGATSGQSILSGLKSYTSNNAQGAKVSRALVAAATRLENTEWLDDLQKEDPQLDVRVYQVQEQDARYKVPKNKGHEAMVYLTYIIDALTNTTSALWASPEEERSAIAAVQAAGRGGGRTDSLPEVTIFIHGHAKTWHNNDLLNSSTALGISRLNSAKVLREGYFGLRCHWGPGCDQLPLRPARVGRGEAAGNEERPEEEELTRAWPVFFPGEPVPEVLSGACCAQFAVSREAVLAVPLERYVAMRRWLLETPLDDFVAGRVFEYTWHYLWRGEWETCPLSEWGCYCDAYGVCFDDGPAGYEQWMAESTANNKLRVAINAGWNEIDITRTQRAVDQRAHRAEHQTERHRQLSLALAAGASRGSGASGQPGSMQVQAPGPAQAQGQGLSLAAQEAARQAAGRVADPLPPPPKPLDADAEREQAREAAEWEATQARLEEELRTREREIEGMVAQMDAADARLAAAQERALRNGLDLARRWKILSSFGPAV